MSEEREIIFFDGLCNFCDNSVQFVLNREREPRFVFCSLQNRPEKHRGGDFPTSDSVILFQNDVYYEKSTAALRIAKTLRWPWNWLYAFIIIPPFIRNTVYDFIAVRRKKWFGERANCRIPTEEERSRFIG
jgi:predicted DCC family thiol-disulfide oxidoreductase YuxK